MAWKDPRDPHDPWAWRNTWTGEARTDYAELWIVIPLIILLVILAFLALLPLFIHSCCRSACPCPKFWSFFDNFLQVLHDYGRPKNNSNSEDSSFENPAFDPELGGPRLHSSTGSRRLHPINDNPRLSHLRHSVRDCKSRSSGASVNRSKSCPPSRPANVPRIKI